ncbi:MAG: alkaline phosphatase D family protein [Planctomycetota bacterium]
MRLLSWVGLWTCVVTFGLLGCAAAVSEQATDATPTSKPVVLPRAERVAAEQTVIAFGSCLKTDQPAPIFDHLLAMQPDVLLMLGDNVYVSRARGEKTPEVFDLKYGELAAQPYWPRLRQDVPLLLATWDDHDYGKNDAGKEWEKKDNGKDAFLEFFPTSATKIPEGRDGVYHAVTVGPEGRRVQFIMLDTRWSRDAIDRKPGPRGARGPYLPSDDTTRTLLGEAQWAWLADVLSEPADVRLIGSSIQVVAREHGWECWGNFPHELARLYRLIDETHANGVVLLSGDRHLGEISKDVDDVTPYPMWDITASGFNQDTRDVDEPNRYRLGGVHRNSHFGAIQIDWAGNDPQLRLMLIGEDGQPFESQTVTLSSLQAAAE